MDNNKYLSTWWLWRWLKRRCRSTQPAQHRATKESQVMISDQSTEQLKSHGFVFIQHLPWVPSCIAVIRIAAYKRIFTFGEQEPEPPIRIPGIPAALSSWLILYSLKIISSYDIQVERWFLKVVVNQPAECAHKVADGACCLVRVWRVSVHLGIRLYGEKKHYDWPPLRR